MSARTCLTRHCPSTHIEVAPKWPDLVGLHAAAPERYPYLLDSVASGTPQARYDILFAFPQAHLWLDRTGRLHGDPEHAKDGNNDFLSALDAWWRAAGAAPAVPASCELPFTGGWFIMLAYELAGQIEPHLSLPQSHPAFPVAWASRCPVAVVRDKWRGHAYLVAEPGYEHLLATLRQDLAAEPLGEEVTAIAVSEVREDDPTAYMDAVRRIREYIRAGDVFQVNVSRGWRATLSQPTAAVDVYRALCRHNPAPFAGLAHWGGQTVISSSPERLLRVREGVAETRPIAGTRPRGTGAAHDAAYSRELIGHPKERAEHIMLIDLERNDLGRVCAPGSVEVDELMVLESYAHVHHIVSNVRGRLRDDVGPGRALGAVFPGGTITGCPKVRCMEIIAELEGVGRGPYTGSMGYLGRDGSLDMNILIRSMLQQGRELYFRAGAGIVADSEPERELAETRSKARGLTLALGMDEP